MIQEVSPVDYAPDRGKINKVRPITPPGRIALDPDRPFALSTPDPRFDPLAPVTINGFRYIPESSGGDDGPSG